MSFEDAVLPRPEFLTDDFLRKCMENDNLEINPEKIQINDVKFKYVVPLGENFCSVLLRAIINEGTAAEKRYIVKMAHTDKNYKEFVDNLQAFPKEKDMLSRLIPAFNVILEEAEIPTQITCRCIHSADVRDTLILEDLDPLGFRVMNKIDGMDLEHCKMVLSKVASLHAASMIYYEKHGVDNLLPFYKYGMVNPRLKGDNLLFSNKTINASFTKLSEILLSRRGYRREGQFIASIKDKAFDLLCDAFGQKQGNIFNAQIHGDFWVNNIMIKSDHDGRPLDVLLIDLQLSSYSSVAIDFVFFFGTSTTLGVIEHNYDDLVRYYLNALKTTLDFLGYRGARPTLKQFNEEICNRSMIFFFIMSFVLSVLKQKINKDDNTSDTLNVGEFVNMSQGGEHNSLYVEYVFALVDLLKRENIFEILIEKYGK